MGISEISEILEKHGPKGAIFIIGLFLLISLFKSKWFSNLLSKASDKLIETIVKKKTPKDNIRSVSESDIINHDIFNYIDFWTYSKVPTFQFSTEYRTAVFRKYLTIYLKSYKKNLQIFVSEAKYVEMDDAKLSTSLLNLINQIVYDYERESENIGIPTIVIEKMKIKNNETIKLKIDLIEGICSSQFYSSDKNLLKVYSILNILLSVLENTISSSESICNSINGALKGLTFDGKKEP
jgi:transposase